MEKLKESAREQIITYIQTEPEYNIFMFGDLEQFGVDSDEVEFFAEIGSDGEYDLLLMRYMEDYVFYTHDENMNLCGVADYLSERNWHMISGKYSLLEKLSEALGLGQPRLTYLSKLTNHTLEQNDNDKQFEIRKLNENDANDIVNLYLDIDEFSANYVGREEIQKQSTATNLRHGGRGFGAFDHGNLISIAATAAESAMGAMLVGVATKKGYRRQGLAGILVSQLSQDCFCDGLQFLCLFYDNPEAGSIYHKIGFVDLGEYGMLKKTD